MKSGKSPTFLWRIFFGSLLLSSLLAILDIRNLALDKGFSLTQPKWLGLIIVIAFMGMYKYRGVKIENQQNEIEAHEANCHPYKRRPRPHN